MIAALRVQSNERGKAVSARAGRRVVMTQCTDSLPLSLPQGDLGGSPAGIDHRERLGLCGARRKGLKREFLINDQNQNISKDKRYERSESNQSGD